MSSNSAVSKGLVFEERVEGILKKSGMKAWRTNKTNPHDPIGYKHGFDGGVDIIATFESGLPYERYYDFYIQCKNHANGITKTAINEVYGGMHARHAIDGYSVPVVIAHGDASQETRQYAKELGVELFLSFEMELVESASKGEYIPYGSYGSLVKALLYYHTKDNIWLQTLPQNKNALSEVTATEKLLLYTMSEFDNAQSHLDKANSLARRANEEQQKALDIQKVVAYRVLEANINLEKRSKKEKSSRKDKPAIDMDSG